MKAGSRPAAIQRAALAGFVSARSNAMAASRRRAAFRDGGRIGVDVVQFARQRPHHFDTLHRQDFADKGGADLSTAIGDRLGDLVAAFAVDRLFRHRVGDAELFKQAGENTCPRNRRLSDRYKKRP